LPKFPKGGGLKASGDRRFSLGVFENTGERGLWIKGERLADEGEGTLIIMKRRCANDCNREVTCGGYPPKRGVRKKRNPLKKKEE